MSADRRREEAWSNRDGDTVSGNDDDKLAPEVVNAKEMSGTAWIRYTVGEYIFNATKQIFHRVEDCFYILAFFDFVIWGCFLWFCCFTDAFSEFVDIVTEGGSELNGTSKTAVSSGSASISI